MRSFFWAHGHIGWFFFAVLVFSVSCLLATDAIWRITPVSLRTLVPTAVVAWTAGIVALIVLGCA